MPGNQFGVLHKGKYNEGKKSGADSMKSGGIPYGGQSGTVRNTQNSGDAMPTPKANKQVNYHGGKY